MQNRSSRLPIAAGVFCLIALMSSMTAFGDGSGKKESPPKSKPDKATEYYNQGVQHAEFEEYEEALEFFEKANRSKKNDPEILNMLAFTQRNMGRLDEAFTNYKAALQIKPDFMQAREYLGEAHIQAALEQIALLRSYGGAGEEELAKLVSAFREATDSLGDGALEKSAGNKDKWKSK